MSVEKKQFYVTKWCLSQGVFKITGALDKDGKYVIQVLDQKVVHMQTPLFLKLNKDVFESAADAYTRAAMIATAREKGLRKQMEKLAALKQEWGKQGATS